MDPYCRQASAGTLLQTDFITAAVCCQASRGKETRRGPRRLPQLLFKTAPAQPLTLIRFNCIIYSFVQEKHLASLSTEDLYQQLKVSGTLKLTDSLEKLNHKLEPQPQPAVRLHPQERHNSMELQHGLVIE